MPATRVIPPAALGLVASAAVALGGWTAGARAIPIYPPRWLSGVRGFDDVPTLNLTGAKIVFWCGLVVLAAAWLWLRVRAKSVPPMVLVAVALVWAAPLVMGPPLASRDAYSYAANGALGNRGLDPAEHPPASLGGSRVLDGVDPIWRYSATPYGPLATGLSRLADRVGDEQPAGEVLMLRGEMVAGYLLLLLASIALARSAGRDPTDAVVLIGANPLVLVHLIGGLHNEALMLGLMMAGLAIAATRPDWLAWAAGVCLTAAALAVKLPAALALGWLAWFGPAWLVAPPRSLMRRAVDAVVAGGLALFTITVIGEVSGAGWGWVGNLNAANRVRGLLSVTTTGAILIGHLFGARRHHQLTGYINVVRKLGQVASAMLTVWLLLRKGDRLAHLGIALLIFGALSPAVYPWYLLWGLAPLAVAWSGRPAIGLVVTSIALCFTVHPQGSAIANNLALSRAGDFRLWLALGIGVAAAAAWRILRAEPELIGL